MVKDHTNKRFYRTSRLMAAACAMTAGAMAMVPAQSATAEPINFLLLGDSITTNVGSTNPYSYYLQDLLVADGFVQGVDYDFLGGQSPSGADTFLSDGVTPFDSDLWGRGGYKAAEGPDTLLIRPPGVSIEFDLQNSPFSQDGGVTTDGVFTTQTGLTRTTATADVILLHVGTNHLWSDDPNNNLGSPSTFTQEALDQLNNLFSEVRVQWDAGNVSADAKILVAKVIPKGSRGSANTAVNDDVLRNTAVYNANIQAVIDALPEATADDIAFKALFTDVVDMFQIDATQELADSLGVATTDLNIDSDQWVDWVEVFDGGTNLQFDESNPLFPNIGGDPVVSNTNILGTDQVHPNDLGYELMANVWYQALLAEGVVPEPSSLALLGLGGLAMLRRRRA